MFTGNSSDLINSPLNVPGTLRDKTLTCGNLYLNENYMNYAVEYDGDIADAFDKIDYASIYVLDENYAVVSIEKTKADDLIKNVKTLVYVEKTSLFTLNSVSPLESTKILKLHNNPCLTLTGKGVLIGIIDTGIDYLNEEFMNEDDTTRIVSLWDQTILSGRYPEDINFGTEYSSEEINKAIDLKKQKGDPYTIVNSKDEVGHGTALSGIMGARGRNAELIGAAPDAQFVVVKLKQAKKIMVDDEGFSGTDVNLFAGTDILLGIKYLKQVARKLDKPMVMLVALGTNRGGHDGSSIIERYIDNIAKTRGLAVVTGTGNEGDSDTHTTGIIKRTGDTSTIELRADDNQKDLNFEIWFTKPDKVSISIVSPSGVSTGVLLSKLQKAEEINLVLEGSNIVVRYFMPEEITGDELIIIRIRNMCGGIWKFILTGDLIQDGKYDSWIPQRALLKENTKFLSPSQFTTLTIPSSSKQALVSSNYNQDDNTLISTSGRGYTRDGRIKPEISTEGYNVETTAVGGGTTTISGSSPSSAVLAGAIAQLLQWGIIDGRDTTLYTPKIKTYIIRGVHQMRGDAYPNSQWGYGELDMTGIFENIRSLVMKTMKEQLYISIPTSVKRYLNI